MLRSSADNKAGDLGFVKQAEELFPGVYCVVVREGIGKSAKMLHPAKAQALIKERVKTALTNPKKFKSFKLETSATMETRSKHENEAARA